MRRASCPSGSATGARRSGTVGPDLSTAARYSADALRRKILDPDWALEAPQAAGLPRATGRPQTRAAPLVGHQGDRPRNRRDEMDFKTSQGSLQNGVLATAGHVPFASIRDGNLVALDARAR